MKDEEMVWRRYIGVFVHFADFEVWDVGEPPS